jgi:hypothetical protein
MSGRAAGWLLLAALAGAAGWWAWVSRTDAEDERLAQARAGAVEAEALSDAGRHDDAADRYLAAADLAATAGDAGLSRALRSQAAVPLKLAGRIDEARAILLPVLEEARASDDRRVEGLALGNLARVEDLAGNDELALSYMDELADFAQREGDVRLEVWTLEQAAATAGAGGDAAGALARIERALQADDGLSGEERRHDALLGQKALLLAQSGDTEGAWTLWAALPVSAATLANRAVSLARWDLHEQASDIAWSAAQAFGEEGEARRAQRDQALLLHLSELIANGQSDHAEDRIQALYDVGGDDPALDPFRMQRARVMLARGRFGEAVDALAGLLSGPGAAPELRVGELSAVALMLAGRPSEALARTETQADDLGRRLLRSWALLIEPPGDALISEAEPGFRSDAWSPNDASLERLRSLSPVELPSPAWLALEIGLSDAARARASGNADLSALLLRDAVREALLWQALDAMAAVPGLPITDDARDVQRKLAEAWIEGRMPEDHAILFLVGGATGSYLILMRPGTGPTTWSLPPEHVLEEQAGRVIEALHGPDVVAIARASHALTSALVPRGAREDLAGATHWTMILPPALAHVPPALLVTEDPGDEEDADETDIAWLVRDRSASLLPHVPGPPAQAAEGASWLSVGAPAIELDGLPLSSSLWLARYGLNVFNAGPPQPVGDGPLLAGAEATVPALRRELPGRAGVRLSLPGAGCGQLGGLAFAPAAGAGRGDEAGGLLTFSRMHTLPLPPLVIMDSTRFDPSDDRYGPNWAATGILVRAHGLLLTRWPVVIALRDAVVGRVLEGRAQGQSLGDALAGVQRDYLETARATGDTAAMHPQLWGAWMPYGLD